VRDDAAGGRQGALAENAPVDEPGAGHEDGAVADLAQVADTSAEDGGAVPEHGALSDLDGMLRPAH
jgi:hypothetical protein